ncbi:MAG: hypothetical protein AAF170_06405 [Bacteroidota bacterium]
MSLALAALILAGCDAGDTCTDELRRITVRVVDEEGAPVKFLRTRLTNTRNLQAIGFSIADSLGEYTLLTDNNLAFVQRSGDLLTFEATDDTVFASAEFTVGREDCHVALFEGPDTIVAEPIDTSTE